MFRASDGGGSLEADGALAEYERAVVDAKAAVAVSAVRRPADGADDDARRRRRAALRTATAAEFMITRLSLLSVGFVLRAAVTTGSASRGRLCGTRKSFEFIKQRDGF